MIKPDYWKKACDFLSSKDKVIAKIIKGYPGETLSSQGLPFKVLCNAIIGQQVSVAAADAIKKRFFDLMPKKNPLPKKVLELDEETMRSVGLSRQKIQYLRNIAEYFIQNKITNKYFEKKPREEIYQELLAIKGIGKWTLEMFQIFYLLDTDIFPLGDIGLIKAIYKNYPRMNGKSKEELEKYSQKWQPYRTVVTWYLWRTFDPEPVAY